MARRTCDACRPTLSDDIRLDQTMRNVQATKWTAMVTGPSLAVLMVSVGCATVDPKPDYTRTRTLIEQSTGVAESYSPEEDGLTTEELCAYLSDGVTADEAVRIALLNNRQLQTAFFDLQAIRYQAIRVFLQCSNMHRSAVSAADSHIGNPRYSGRQPETVCAFPIAQATIL